MAKVLTRILLLIVFLAILVIAASFLAPGLLPEVDELRLSAQAPVMEMAGETHLGDFLTDADGNAIDKPDMLTMALLEAPLAALSPGDIFLTESVQYLSAEFTPGKWKHAGIYLGTPGQINALFSDGSALRAACAGYPEHTPLILDSGSAGVTIRPFIALSDLETVSQLKCLAVFRLRKGAADIRAYIEKAYTYLNRPYDYDMRTDDENALYCSELVYHSMHAAGIHADVRSEVAGRSLVSPADLARFFYETEAGGKAAELVGYYAAQEYALRVLTEEEFVY